MPKYNTHGVLFDEGIDSLPFPLGSVLLQNGIGGLFGRRVVGVDELLGFPRQIAQAVVHRRGGADVVVVSLFVPGISAATSVQRLNRFEARNFEVGNLLKKSGFS